MTIDELREKGLIIYEVLSGSQLYGTNTPESDEDRKGVFVLPLDMILSNQYVEQISDTKNDITFYELGRFIQLLQSSNPNMLESLFAPDHAIFYKHPIMNQILSQKDKFLTKECNNSLVGYSRAQIGKSKGLNKMQNWEKEKMTRKTVLDFVYTHKGQGSTHIKNWLDEKGFKQEYCGLVAIPNMRYSYGVYYDIAQHCQFEKLSYLEFSIFTNPFYSESHYNQIMDGTFKNLKYKGIVQKLDISNDVSLSSTHSDAVPICNVTFNKDGYEQHCAKWKSYETWLRERNTARYVDNKAHGQAYDSKNLMHCVRLLRMGKEIGLGLGMNVYREDREYLLSIRKGEMELGDLIAQSEEYIKEIDEIFANSDLPLKIDKDFCNNLLLEMRKEFYKL